jgi:hypothetical protein
VIALLAETFPKCFSVYQPRRRPLKLGIHKDVRLFGNRWLLQYAHGISVLSFSFSRFLNELHLGKLSETVVVVSNAPHDRPRFLVSHLIGHRASFLCTKAPMPRVISVWHRD